MAIAAICKCDVCGVETTGPKDWYTVSYQAPPREGEPTTVYVWNRVSSSNPKRPSLDNNHVCGLECMHKMVDRLLTDIVLAD